MEGINAVKEREKRLHCLLTTLDEWHTAHESEFHPKKNAPSCVRNCITYVKNYLVSALHVVYLECLSKPRRHYPPTEVVRDWDTAFIPDVTPPRIFQGNESWVSVEAHRPHLRVIKGGKSDEAHVHVSNRTKDKFLDQNKLIPKAKPNGDDSAA